MYVATTQNFGRSATFNKLIESYVELMSLDAEIVADKEKFKEAFYEDNKIIWDSFVIPKSEPAETLMSVLAYEYEGTSRLGVSDIETYLSPISYKYNEENEVKMNAKLNLE